MLDPRQLLDRVVAPALFRIAAGGGTVAEQLVMGTGAQESGFAALAQHGGGPALGLFQMEPSTFHDLWDRFLLLPGNRALLRSLGMLLAPWPSPLEQLATNLAFSAAMCRVRYLAQPFKMPAFAGVDDLAALWKRWYNTPEGRGTPEQFSANFRRLVAPIY